MVNPRIPTVIGLDMSSTCTGIALPDGTTDHYKPAGDLLDRAIATRNWINDYLFPTGANLVVIEDIGTNRVAPAIALAYVHAHTTHTLRTHNIPTIKIAPTVLKKWATGRGNADKHTMTLHALRNGWNPDGDEGSTDDEADAWHLWTLGRSLLHAPVIDHTTYRTDILNQLDKTLDAA